MGDMMVEGLFSLGLQGGRVMILSGGGVGGNEGENQTKNGGRRISGGSFFSCQLLFPFSFSTFFSLYFSLTNLHWVLCGMLVPSPRADGVESFFTACCDGGS
jgi:hypothetical protein